MHGITAALLFAVAASAAAGPAARDVAHPTMAVERMVPDPRLQDDPADSLYRRARAALNRGQYAQAADLFREITSRYPTSGYAGDALYWRAFALYRRGGVDNLKQAQQALEQLREKYPKAASKGDAKSLATRITGALARGGDPDAAEAVAAAAAEAAEAADAVAAATAPAAAAARAARPPRPGRVTVPVSRSECRDDDDEKLAAIHSLLQMDADRALPILKKVLTRRDEASACLRRKAVFLVAQKRTSETEDILLGAARNDPDAEVRQQAVFWLSQVPTERATAALDSILRTATDIELQKKAAFALSQQGNPRAAAALRAVAERKDVDSEVREQAIFWIGQNATPDDVAFLQALYGRINERELKNRIIFSVSQARGADRSRWLLDIARNGNEPIEQRKQALFWAGQTGASMSDLAAIYNTVSDREMKEQLIFVYSQRKDGLDKLIEIARKEPDAELRKKALFWVGQSRDPRAVKLIEEILDQ
ncbi:MAG: HEAT repeat domain-containing protein [Gemmatimonadota bacterium]